LDSELLVVFCHDHQKSTILSLSCFAVIIARTASALGLPPPHRQAPGLPPFLFKFFSGLGPAA
jgi:hypothetical protein